MAKAKTPAAKKLPKLVKSEGPKRVKDDLQAFRSDNSIAVKHRPTKVDQIVGQEAAKAHINGFIAKKNIPKTIAFLGPTGCGKTTLARMLALMVNGTSQDTYEYNVGDQRSINDIRQIAQQMKYKPNTVGGLSFFIFDEAHCLLNASSSALLKVIEEPPPHVVVILCTNEPDKLLTTLRNRCEKITLTTVDDAELGTLLKRVMKHEEMDFGKDAKRVIEHICRHAGGIPREALQMLSGIHNMYLGFQKQGDKLAFEKSTTGSNEVTLDAVAVKILVGIYRKKPTMMVKAIYDTKDYHALMYRLFDLNSFLVQDTSGVRTYLTDARKLLKKHVGEVPLARVLKVHKQIVACREKMNTYLVAPEHSLLTVLSEAM